MGGPRLRSHRLALVAAVLVLGVGACGSDDDSARTATDGTTSGAGAAPSSVPGTSPAGTVAPDGPQVIEVGDAASSGAPEVAAADVASESDASTKIMAAGIEFVFDGSAAELTEPAASWSFPQVGLPSAEAVSELAAQFGLDGEVLVLDEDRGGGLAVGAIDDYSQPSLMVGTDAMQSWWYNAGDAGQVVPFCEPVVGSSGTDVAKEQEQTCETKPPANVPTKEQAEAKTTALLDQLGLDPASVEYETYADEWNASVNAFLVLDGVRSNVAMYVSYGAEGALTWAGGFLAEPQRGDDYARIGVTAAVERLNEPNWLYGGDPAVLRAEGTDAATMEEAAPPVTDGGSAEPAGESGDVPAETLVAPVDPLVDPPECDPAADCVPFDTEPITVRLSNPRPSLEQLWAEDGTVWLLPGYAFDGDDTGIYTVIAVDRAYLAVDEPETDPATEPTEETVVADTVAPDASEPVEPPHTTPVDSSTAAGCPEFELVTGRTDAPFEGEDGAEFIGLCTEDAAQVAEGMEYVFRVVREDGVDLAVTEDFVENRMNVAVEAGIVTELVFVG